MTDRPGVSRRAMFGVGAGTLAAGAAAGFFAHDPIAEAVGAENDIVDFFGRHQAGIVTEAQDRMCFAAVNVLTDDRDELIDLLTQWTAAAANLSRGLPVVEDGVAGGSRFAPPMDTGEAQGLSAGHLTVTIGFGRSLFTDADGQDRFGIADRLPSGLIELPHFPGDRLDEARTGGDLCLQACADDPQVAVHAVRNLIRMGFGIVSTRWMQLGFGRTASTSPKQGTPRNLFGFKDGTANIRSDEEKALGEHVWVRDGSWMDDGCYLVARRIRMHIETWDRESLDGQEQIFGRTKMTGAPLSGGEEFTEPDFGMAGAGNLPIIPTSSHVHLAHPKQNGGTRILRRGYNYADGADAQGNLDAGLFFIAFVADPASDYVPMQNRLAKEDALSEYLLHTGSGLFAIPPGVNEGGWIGQTLFA
ncbi:iron uptake transporter deferrochelatase/peroxidase subunit [Brevibacterium casei]|uniref:iron uptake transporter deferrochelatase/peroxidase subunit n=1 Tax=Brevibacterium casei TaxID=33889 RepID=UPI000E64BFF4|nr:iron uptake transporter deferrochelatase/peroxidase subunit [Brevibacterium casei]MCT1551409.1 iron uptake transporter deferrochelatase/peroxidase subunit [Brevibacterium casei]MCT1560852.1 iron uptake transporter deferrochelatase/peroxidase subunit [Brevibacterium casei]MCT2209217.1 iron uptake transporter deferrochelatase/peroxidase subunit [Brevibacterium casei]